MYKSKKVSQNHVMSCHKNEEDERRKGKENSKKEKG